MGSLGDHPQKMFKKLPPISCNLVHFSDHFRQSFSGKLFLKYILAYLSWNMTQGCKFSDFCLISENFTSKYLKMFFEITSL